MILWGRGPSHLHHTPPLDSYGASLPPYWNPKYATATKWPLTTKWPVWRRLLMLRKSRHQSINSICNSNSAIGRLIYWPVTPPQTLLPYSSSGFQEATSGLLLTWNIRETRRILLRVRKKSNLYHSSCVTNVVTWYKIE